MLHRNAFSLRVTIAKVLPPVFGRPSFCCDRIRLLREDKLQIGFSFVIFYIQITQFRPFQNERTVRNDVLTIAVLINIRPGITSLCCHSCHLGIWLCVAQIQKRNFRWILFRQNLGKFLIEFFCIRLRTAADSHNTADTRILSRIGVQHNTVALHLKKISFFDLGRINSISIFIVKCVGRCMCHIDVSVFQISQVP